MKRREFLRALFVLPVIGALFGVKELQEETGTLAPLLSYDPEPIDVSISWNSPMDIVAWNETIIIKSTSGGMSWEVLEGYEVQRI